MAKATEDDCVILLGDPVLQAILVMVMMEKFGRVNVLKFDRRKQCYSNYPVDSETQPSYADSGF
jgi:hypothetical protein